MELDPGRVSRVVLPVAGRVREVLAALGDPVKRGQPLLTLDSPEVSALQSTLRQAEASESQAKATLAKSEADLARVRDLLANRAIAQKEVLSAETVMAQSKAALEQALAGRDDVARKLGLLGLEAGDCDPADPGRRTCCHHAFSVSGPDLQRPCQEDRRSRRPADAHGQGTGRTE